MKTVSVPVSTPTPLEVPGEIRAFLKNSGNVLLVRGAAGAGKTTFALEAMRILSDPSRAVYLTSRTNDVMLYSHFPWISQEWRRQVVDTSALLREQFFHKATPDAEAEKPHSREEGMKRLRRFLGGALATKLSPSDVERLSASEDGIGSQNLVVLDSLEGLAGPLGRDAVEFFHDFREIAVEDYGASVVVVLEQAGPSPLDYLADGIVELQVDRGLNRLVREFRIEKLRGVTINNPSYLYTLHNGRFQAFGPDRGGRYRPRVPAAGKSGSHLSTGIPSLDDVTGGGYPWGSAVLVEFDEDVDDQLLEALVYTPMSVALQQDHAAYVYPPFGQDAWSTHHALTRHLPPGAETTERLKIATYTPAEDGEKDPFLLYLDLEAEDAVADLGAHFRKVMDWTETVGEERKVVLALSWDQAELQYDQRQLEITLGKAVNRVQAEDWLLLVFRKRDRSRPKDNLPKVARMHVRVDTTVKVPTLTVERPYLGTFGLREDAEGMRIVPFK